MLIAGDIIRTAVETTWTQIGQLAAIVIVRTAINYTLMRDIKDAVAEDATIAR